MKSLSFSVLLCAGAKANISCFCGAKTRKTEKGKIRKKEKTKKAKKEGPEAGAKP